MLYLRLVNLKRIVSVALPLLVFAFPLLLLVWINSQGLESTRFLSFTIPKIPNFRNGDFSLANLKENWSALWMLLTHDEYSFDSLGGAYNTLYPISIPFVLFGIPVSFCQAYKKIRSREFDTTTILFTFFCTVCFCIMIVDGPCIYRANSIYFTMVFMAIMGIRFIVNSLPALPIQCYVTRCIACIYIIYSVFFLRYYFVDYGKEHEIQWFVWDYIDDIYAALAEANLDGREVYVDNYNGPTYAYDCLIRQISPYDYNLENDEMTEYENLGNYHYYLPQLTDIMGNEILVVFDFNGQGGYNGYGQVLEAMGFRVIPYGYFKIYYVR